jgi:predicted amidophosphoribosyltransferase
MASVFREEYGRYNRPGHIVTFGPYLPTAGLMDADGALRYVREGGATGYDTGQLADMRRAVRWTRWVNALNLGRKWIQNRLFTRLNEMLEPGIAVATVPAHDPFRTDAPIVELARRLAAEEGRTDATGALVRHAKIHRISYGGPSYRSLHRQTITVTPPLVAGRTVLLLDDIARSGASLRACEGLLYEAGAEHVQAVALVRVAG